MYEICFNLEQVKILSSCSGLSVINIYQAVNHMQSKTIFIVG